MEPTPIVDYAGLQTSPRGWTPGWIIAIIFASFAFLWSFIPPTRLVISNHGPVAGNEGFGIHMLIDFPSDTDYKANSIKSFAGFYYIDWTEWTRNGRYLVVPLWATISTTGTLLIITIFLGRRSANQYDPANLAE